VRGSSRQRVVVYPRCSERFRLCVRRLRCKRQSGPPTCRINFRREDTEAAAIEFRNVASLLPTAATLAWLGSVIAEPLLFDDVGDVLGRISSALTQTEGTGIWASFSKIALGEVVHTNGRQSLLWASM
jgi:hypothetical protein